MRAITGAVVSSEPCTLTEAHDVLSAFCRSHDSDLASSDGATYIVALDDAIKEHHRFLRRCGRRQLPQQGAADHQRALCNEAAMVDGGRENGGGPQGSVEDAKVAVDAGERKSRMRNKEEEPHDHKADGAGVPSHDPGEILFEQSWKKKKKKEEKHSSKELVSVVKQEPDLVVKGDSKSIKDEVDKMASDSDLNSKKKKKKKKRGRGDDDVDALQEQGEHKKKKRRKESRE